MGQDKRHPAISMQDFAAHSKELQRDSHHGITVEYEVDVVFLSIKLAALSLQQALLWKTAHTNQSTLGFEIVYPSRILQHCTHQPIYSRVWNSVSFTYWPVIGSIHSFGAWFTWTSEMSNYPVNSGPHSPSSAFCIPKLIVRNYFWGSSKWNKGRSKLSMF